MDYIIFMVGNIIMVHTDQLGSEEDLLINRQ